MAGVQDNLGDLSWLGEEFADQGWIQVEGEEQTVSQASPASIAWEKAKELLRQSDWAVLPDVPLTGAEKVEWVEYRAALRDIRMQLGFPNDIAWPTKPE